MHATASLRFVFTLAGVLKALAGSLGWLLGSRASMSALGMMNLIVAENLVIVYDGCFSEAGTNRGCGWAGVSQNMTATARWRSSVVAALLV